MRARARENFESCARARTRTQKFLGDAHAHARAREIFQRCARARTRTRKIFKGAHAHARARENFEFFGTMIYVTAFQFIVLA